MIKFSQINTNSIEGMLLNVTIGIIQNSKKTKTPDEILNLLADNAEVDETDIHKASEEEQIRKSRIESAINEINSLRQTNAYMSTRLRMFDDMLMLVRLNSREGVDTCCNGMDSVSLLRQML